MTNDVRMAVALPVATASAMALFLGVPRLFDGNRLTPELSAKLNKLVQRYEEQLIPNEQRLAELSKEFTTQMREGLTKNVAVDGKRMMMIPTHVTRLPDGTETGECYALDLGGTNFRVMRCVLGPGKGEVAACDVEEVTIPPHVYTGPGEQLFDFLARALSTFIDKHQADTAAQRNRDGQEQPEREALPVVGFCFSFAVQQTGLASGVLLDWTKGFTCPGVVGKDPVALLAKALERAGRPCRIAVLLNDTVGVLAAQRYLDSDTEVGVILGTGTNACYVEELGRLTKWAAPAGAAAASGGRTAINMEWGAFFSPQLPRCMEDLQVDATSPNPGKYLFEKLLSGMFLGEAARNILHTLAKEVPGLFRSKPATAAAPGSGTPDAAASAIPAPLAKVGALPTATLSKIAEDGSWKLLKTRVILARELGVYRPSRKAGEVAQRVCRMVTQRSAELTAMAVIAILRHSGWGAGVKAGPVEEGAGELPKKVTVAFDGGVYERFGLFRTMLQDALVRQVGAELAGQVSCTLSHDGSALGAAVLAAAATAAAAAAYK